ERAVVTDMSEQGFRVRIRDKQTALRVARRAAVLLRRFVREAPAVAERYRAELPRLSSRENWMRLYGLEECRSGGLTGDAGEPPGRPSALLVEHLAGPRLAAGELRQR